MQLIHYRHTVPNFGDDLNADLWPALAPALFLNREEDRGFVGIGTIIGIEVGAIGTLDIFSSGAGYDRVERWAGKTLNVHCVRGPLTARLLGADPALVLTDGAILTPLLPDYPDRGTGGGGTVVVPHFQTIASPGWAEACEQAGFTLVDPRGAPTDVVRQLAGADLVLAESLHGAALADIYDVPWIPFGTSRNLSVSKWTDWLASLALDYRPTLVPPPHAGHLLRYGKRGEEWGKMLTFSLDQAMAEFRTRIAPFKASPARELLKTVLGKVSPLQRMLGYGPARTAEALVALAKQPTTLSDRTRRDDLRDRMVAKLEAFERSYR